MPSSAQRLPFHKGSCHGEAVTERFERNGFDNLSVICFANATSPEAGEASRRSGERADGVVRPYSHSCECGKFFH